ncbi:hypothetical protein FJZ33_01665 [Candidatus Poribacteria bacterium]|nr:hypothetical protein [Candidatus Poribacteria bacterium]
MGIKITKIIILLVILQCILTIHSHCIPASDNDINAIKNLFLKFERGYEERNIEKYMSVFSHEQYTYISDMATPDDPSDDIKFSRAEDERRSAIKVFECYENLDLELTNMQFSVNGDSAEVKARIKIVFVIFQENGSPEVYYAIVNNTFRLKKSHNQWKIIRWQQNEMSPEVLAAWSQQESKSKSINDFIRDLGNPNMVKWAIAISDLRKNIDTSMNELIKALRSSNKNLRIRSAWTLAGNNNNNVIQEFIRILKNENEDVDIRIAVINSAVECDNQDIDNELMIASKSSEPKIRAAALLASAKRIRRRIDELNIHYCNDSDEIVRKSAIESLKIIISLPKSDINRGIGFSYKTESEEIRLASMEFLEQLRPNSAP